MEVGYSNPGVTQLQKDRILGINVAELFGIRTEGAASRADSQRNRVHS